MLLLVAGAAAAYLLWSLLTADAAAAVTPEATAGKVIDVDLGVGAPTQGAPLEDARPPLDVAVHVDPTAIPPLADAPFQPIEIGVSTAPPRIDLPPLLPPIVDANKVGAQAPARAEAGTGAPPHKGRTTPPATKAKASHTRSGLTARFAPSSALEASNALPGEPAVPVAGPGTSPVSDGVPVPPLLLAVLGAAFALAALKPLDWSWLERAVRSTLLAPALDRPG